MRGTLIFRLVDITLLLLLSLMAAASIVTPGPELPVTQKLDPVGALSAPVSVIVEKSGALVLAGVGELSVLELVKLLARSDAPVEFLADGSTLARRLLEIHSEANAAGLDAAFVVQRASRKTP